MSDRSQIVVVKNKSRQWFYAWKVANVCITVNYPRTIKFVPTIAHSVTYGMRDQARCVLRNSHPVPANNCQCGFNAWHDVATAEQYLDGYRRLHEGRLCHIEQRPESLTLLRVALSGDVIEGTLSTMPTSAWGYRASKQQVTDIFFSTVCTFCRNDATGLALARKKYPVPGDSGLHYPVRPSCGGHGIHLIIQPEQLMKHNDVAIHWGHPSEQDQRQKTPL